METKIIEVQGIGKKYNISHDKGKYITLRDIISNVLRSPFKFIKHKTKLAVGLTKKEEFWALSGVDFSVNKGEVIGIIGKNGAGKSTLLKILSQITPPTEGKITIRGKIGSLLEVGTGFHPELTGRENIFLNGAILGMTKKEIVHKFDKIIEFAGIEKFLDTPVKYYSSGMYVRLAFSVAAHMDPDILLVDEVLAVGDADFQKKCLGKMNEITKSENRTILFVSHNMAAVQSLCKRTILLDGGKVIAIGDTHTIIDQYLSSHLDHKSIIDYPEIYGAKASIRKVSLSDTRDSFRSEFPISENFNINIKFTCHEMIENATLSVKFYSSDRELLLYSSEADTSGKLSKYEPGDYEALVKVPSFVFNVGNYSFDIILHTPNISLFAEIKDFVFEIKNIENPRSIIFGGNSEGKVAMQLPYSIHKIN